MRSLRWRLLAEAARWSFQPQRVVYATQMVNPTYVQTNFRGRNDDVTLNSATFTYNLNTNWTQEVGVVFRVRFEFEETAAATQNNSPIPQLQYNLGGAGWNNVTVDSNVVRAVVSGQFNEGDATTNVISGSGRAFVASSGSEDGIAATVTDMSNQHTEVEYAIKILRLDVAVGNTIELRVSDAGAAFNTYSQTPTITVAMTQTDPVLWMLDGFEHGNVLGSGTTAVYNAAAGSPEIVSSPVRNGSRSLKIDTTAAIESVAYFPPASTRIAVAGIAVYFPTLPTSTAIIHAFANPSGNGVVRYNSTSGFFEVAIGGGAGVTCSGTIAAATWYWITVFFDCSTATARIAARTNDANEGVQTSAQAAADISSIRAGTTANHTFVGNLDDWHISLRDNDYPIQDRAVVPLLPSADGTHSQGSGAYQDQVAGSLSGSTTSWQLIDDVPLDVTPTDFIRQTGNDTASYMEHLYDDMPGGIPLDVRALSVDRDESGTGTALNIFRALLSDDTAVTPDIRLSTDDPGVSVTVRRKMLDRPSGGWTKAKVDGLKTRWGFGDGAPDADLASAMFEVSYAPLPTVVMPLLDARGSVFEPAITVTAQTVEMLLKASETALFNPALQQNVSLPLKTADTALFEPSVDQQVQLPLKGSDTTLFDPAIQQIQSVVTPSIDPATQLFDPAVQPGPVNVGMDFIAAASQTFDPKLIQLVQTPLLQQTISVFDPSTFSIVELPLISSASNVFEPTVQPGSVTVVTPLIASQTQLFELAVGVGQLTVGMNFLGSATQLFNFDVQPGAVNVGMQFISAMTTVYSPGLRSVVQTPLIASGTALFDPAVIQHVVAPLLVSTSSVFAPSVLPGAVTVSMLLLDATGAVFTPSVSQGSVTVVMGFLDSQGTVFTPAVQPDALTVGMQFISSQGQIFDPAVAPGSVEVIVPLIASIAQVFDPTVSIGQTFVAVPRIESTAQLFDPSVAPGAVTAVVPLIGSTVQLFDPVLIQQQFVQAPVIGTQTSVFDPQVTQRITTPLISSLGQAFTPGVTLIPVIAVPLIGSNTLLFEHSVEGGLALVPITLGAMYSPNILLGARYAFIVYLEAHDDTL